MDAGHHHGLVDFFHHVVDGYEGDVNAGNGFGRDAFADFRGNGYGGFDVGEFDIDIEIDADVLQGKGLVKRDKQSDLLDALYGGDTGDVEDACVLVAFSAKTLMAEVLILMEPLATAVRTVSWRLSFSRTELKLNILCLRENRILCHSIVD